MGYSSYELLWMFLVYSFAGWIIETIYATIRKRRFVNRGLINGPFCLIYGFSAAVLSVVLQELDGFWLFFGCMVYSGIIEWVAGYLIQKLFRERWWDYSRRRANIGGYVCLFSLLVWGALGFLAVKWGNVLVIGGFDLLPEPLVTIFIWSCMGMLLLDAVASIVLKNGKSKYLNQWQEANNQIIKFSRRLEHFISERINERIHKAYEVAFETDEMKKESAVFAQECSYYKIILLFFVGAFAGDLIETVFCRITMGEWMSRSSVVWGHFSIVWGLAIALVTLFLYKFKDRKGSFLFWMGTLLGGAYEYLCSVFTEMVFGTVFWDYSWIPLNLGGRINLLYCFFWGFAAVIWFWWIYPIVSRGIEKIPAVLGKTISWSLLVFMICNVLVSGFALVRYNERSSGIRASQGWQSYMDAHYGDEKMQHIYPKALQVNELDEGKISEMGRNSDN